MTIRNAATMGNYGATWEAHGYCGQGNVAELVDSCLGRPALICGAGQGVFEEMRIALSKLDDPVIVAANAVGMFLPRVDHWVSLHPDHLVAWKAVRWLHPREREATKYHSDSQRAWLDYCWQQLTPMFCLSGYLAMQIAWVLGCRPIVLCGCPGDGRERFYDLEPRADFAYSEQGTCEQIEKEMTRVPEFREVVRSMSGWTRSYFGSL